MQQEEKAILEGIREILGIEAFLEEEWLDMGELAWLEIHDTQLILFKWGEKLNTLDIRNPETLTKENLREFLKPITGFLILRPPGIKCPRLLMRQSD